MGQATVDLPDPLDNPSPAPTTSADDLLAQLAGDEIDRLLAEADVVPNEPPASPDPQPQADLKSSAGMVDVFAELEVKDKVEAKSAPPSNTSAGAIADGESSVVSTVSEEIGVAERAGLGGELAVAKAAPALDLGPTRNVPFFLKPLVWLNAPLDACPDAVREALGKIAILTLVNACAVLAYVLIFRKHH